MTVVSGHGLGVPHHAAPAVPGPGLRECRQPGEGLLGLHRLHLHPEGHDGLQQQRGAGLGRVVSAPLVKDFPKQY